MVCICVTPLASGFALLTSWCRSTTRGVYIISLKNPFYTATARETIFFRSFRRILLYGRMRTSGSDFSQRYKFSWRAPLLPYTLYGIVGRCNANKSNTHFSVILFFFGSQVGQRTDAYITLGVCDVVCNWAKRGHGPDLPSAENNAHGLKNKLKYRSITIRDVETVVSSEGTDPRAHSAF